MAPHSTSTANVMAERAAIDATVEGKTLVDVFNRNARDYADKAAIHWKEGDIWRHLTWSQYRRSVHEAAAGLISLGVSGGDFVAIMVGQPARACDRRPGGSACRGHRASPSTRRWRRARFSMSLPTAAPRSRFSKIFRS